MTRNCVLAVLFAEILLFIPGINAQTRLRGSLDASRMVPLSGHVHPAARVEFDRGPVDPSMPVSNVILGLKLSPVQQADLEQFLASQQNPASLDYHRWLTPDQFAARFGAPQSDVDQITAWLTSRGLTIDAVASSRNWIAFSGTADTVGRALRTEFHRYVNGVEAHFANAIEPSIPAALAPIVSGLAGLNDYHPRRGQVPLATSPDGSHVPGPADIALIYDVQQLYNAGIDGTGQSIAIAGQSTIKTSDVTLFRNRYNLGPANVTTKTFGPAPQQDVGAEQEADLDVEWSGAIAPKANIVLVYSNDAFHSLIYAIDQNLAPIASMSFGDCERYWVEDALLYQNVMQQANAQGMTVVIAGGDGGAVSCDLWFINPVAANGLAASFPASIPEVTAVGGSQFSDTRGNYWGGTADSHGAFVLSYIPEAVWNETSFDGAIASGGGGVSTVFPKPTWQAGQGVPNDGFRDLPDIALNASADHDGFLICSEGTCGVTGGTSASAPVFAGMLALVNHYLTSKGVISQPGLGNVNPVLYRMAANTPNAFHDITAGNNNVPCGSGTPGCTNGQIGFSAGPGYDLATGLGSLDLFNLATQWDRRASNTPAMTLTATPSSATLNDTIQLTSMLQGGSSPTGQVTFSYQGGAFLGSSQLTGAAYLGAVNLAGSSASLSVPADELAIGNGTIVASYPGDANNNAATATATANVSLPSTGSAVVPSVDPPAVPETIDPGGPSWDYTITLHNLSTIATTVTGMTVDGQNYGAQIVNFFGTATIRSRGTISADLSATGVKAPVTRVFTFSGVDADGTMWTRTLNVRFLGLEQLLQVGGVSNAASADTVFAPGMLVSAYGLSLSNATAASAPSLPLPLKLGGSSATVNGVPAPLWYTSYGQLNVQIPYETQPGVAILTVNNGLETASFSFNVGSSAPGIFVNANTNAPVPFSGGHRGSTYTLFITGDGVPTPSVATGSGPADPNNLPKPQLPLRVTVGGATATITFAGIPTWSAGVTQINFTVPNNAPLGQQPLVVSVGGVRSIPATFNVQQ